MGHIHLQGLAGKVKYAQLLNDASEIHRIVNDPGQEAQNTTMGGVSSATLTLKLPIQKPNVLVPVIELFL
jgi:alpha-L-fucosidase